MNISGNYKKVWKVDVKPNVVKVDLGDSKKNKDGSYSNWTWFGVAFVGKAKELAETLQEKDTIEVINGMISQDKGQDGKYYTNLVVFDFNITQKADGSQGYSSEEMESDIPF